MACQSPNVPVHQVSLNTTDELLKSFCRRRDGRHGWAYVNLKSKTTTLRYVQNDSLI